jgi:hypothetical protein
VLQIDEGSADVACKLRFFRQGDVGTFATGDGTITHPSVI